MENLLAVLAPITALGIFVAIAVIAVALAVWSVRKTRDGLARLARDLGLQLHEKPPVLGLFRSTPMVDGELGGRKVRFFELCTGSGKSRQTWSAVSVGCANPHDFRLRLGPQSFLTKLGEKFGLQDVSVGDPPFDEKFVVQTNAPEFLRAALLPEMRDPLLRHWPAGLAGASLKIEGGEVVYADCMPFSDEKLLLRMESLVDVLIALAALPEAYSA
jgi:hypothetical protein